MLVAIALQVVIIMAWSPPNEARGVDAVPFLHPASSAPSERVPAAPAGTKSNNVVLELSLVSPLA